MNSGCVQRSVHEMFGMKRCTSLLTVLLPTEDVLYLVSNFVRIMYLSLIKNIHN